MGINVHPGKIQSMPVSVRKSGNNEWFDVSFKDIVWESHAGNTIIVLQNNVNVSVEYNSMHFKDPDDEKDRMDMTCRI